ncbi:MAG: anti-sigma regulatory factor [Deltaproteobacteria bacterium]|nr:anti-sigma regulatory factor [Deltaproteobacteria bacterium]
MSQLETEVLGALRVALSDIIAKSVYQLGLSWSKVDTHRMGPGDGSRLLAELEKGIRIYARDPAKRDACVRRLTELLKDGAAPRAEPDRRLVVSVDEESDIVTARGMGRDLCRELGFSMSVQVKVATAISELARNIVQYAGRGRITITALLNGRRGIEITAYDEGPGIPNMDEILNRKYRSTRGMGMGLVGTRNLMDEFEVRTGPREGTVIRVRKYLS